jgi:hypothetical protein
MLRLKNKDKSLYVAKKIGVIDGIDIYDEEHNLNNTKIAKVLEKIINKNNPNFKILLACSTPVKD